MTYIKNFMDRHNLSQSDFAKQLGVHRSQVSRWLNGQKMYDENLFAVCELIADYDGISINQAFASIYQEQKK